MKGLLIFLLCSNILRAQSVEGIDYRGGFKECYHQIYKGFIKTQVTPWPAKELDKTRYYIAKILVKGDGHLGDEITVTAFPDTTNSSSVVDAIRLTDGSWINPGADRFVYLPIYIQVYIDGPVPLTPIMPVSTDIFLKDKRQPVIELPPLIIKEGFNT